MDKYSVDEIKKAAQAQGYTDSEVKDFVDMAARFACKPVLHSLINLIEYKTNPDRAKESKTLIKKINKLIKYQGTSYISLEMEEHIHPLYVQLTLADKDYRCQIDVPSREYAGELFKRYDFLKLIAVAYWRQFISDNTALFKRICDFCQDVDLSNLKIDPSNATTLYWDKEQPKRVSILSYYYDGKTAYYKVIN